MIESHILTDKRPIKMIAFDGTGAVVYTVGGPTHVSKIEPYEESDGTLWFAVYIGSKLTERVCARAMAVVLYFEEPDTVQ